MMGLDLPEGLNDVDALSLLIGRIARSHVILDAMLISLHQELGGSGASCYLAGGMKTSRLIQDCRLMVKHIGLGEEHVAIGLSVLDAAAEANSRRNRVIHDMWMPVYDGPKGEPIAGKWQTAQSKSGTLGRIREPGTKDLQHVARSNEQLIEAFTRVNSFHGALTHLMSRGVWFGIAGTEDDLKSELDTARGTPS